MHPEFEDIFKYLADRYRYGRYTPPPRFIGPDWGPGAWIYYARRLELLIDTASEKAGVTLRADAKFFLLTNLDAMVVAPLAAAMSGRPELDVPSLDDDGTWERLQDDLVVILQGARRGSSRRASSHRVLEVLASSWSKLWLGTVRVWGEDDDS